MGKSPSEIMFDHVDNCERCQRWYLTHGLCPEGDRLATQLAENPIPRPAAQA